jgi:CheY-like chemotaxis protein
MRESVKNPLGTPPEVVILIADDDPLILSLLRDILCPVGYQVVEATNGNQALSQLRQRKVDLIITDLMMPGMDGLELIRAVRREFPEIPMIAMSGGFGEQFLPIAEVLGSQAILSKPFKVDRVKEMVGGLWRR